MTPRRPNTYRAVDIDPVYCGEGWARQWLFNRKVLHTFPSKAARDAWVAEEPYSYEMKGRKSISREEAREILTFSNEDAVIH